MDAITIIAALIVGLLALYLLAWILGLIFAGIFARKIWHQLFAEDKDAAKQGPPNEVTRTHTMTWRRRP